MTQANSARKSNSSKTPASENFDQFSDSAHVRLPTVKELFACSAATVWRGVKDGRIPKPRKLSERITAWNVGDLRRALAGDQ